MAAYIHHVQLCTKHGSKFVQKFVQNANFKLFAERSTESIRQWAVRSGSAVFVINQPVISNEFPPASEYDETESRRKLTSSSSCKRIRKLKPEEGFDNIPSKPILQNIPSSCFSSDKDRNIDTVFNVAFEVPSVEKTVERAQQNGAKVLCEPTEVLDDSGRVVVASVQSCIGNVVHMLVNTSDYHGDFLPGFCGVKSHISVENNHSVKGQLSHLDHVTFAADMGASSHILEWYEKCFGMKRFKLSRDEDDCEGFLVEGQNVGLRMKAMEYWRCAETGLAMTSHDTNRPSKAKFVIAEALEGQGPNQVETFLEQHGGPGIQHIGLYAPNIFEACKQMKKSGFDFLQPPGAYYTEIGKLREMVEVGENPDKLRDFGILLDAESFVDESSNSSNGVTSDSISSNGVTSDSDYRRNHLHNYLMQIFTKPIFDRDTFFLEIIQRCGATGFGAGNITALWRAVAQYMDDCSETKQSEIGS